MSCSKIGHGNFQNVFFIILYFCSEPGVSPWPGVSDSPSELFSFTPGSWCWHWSISTTAVFSTETSGRTVSWSTPGDTSGSGQQLSIRALCLTEHSRSLRFSCKLEREERSFTMCGDSDYRAPEMLLEQGYSFPIDW